MSLFLKKLLLALFSLASQLKQSRIHELEIRIAAGSLPDPLCLEAGIFCGGRADIPFDPCLKVAGRRRLLDEGGACDYNTLEASFVKPKDLVPGSTLYTKPGRHLSPRPKFLPQSLAKSIPFSTPSRPFVMKLLRISPSSPMAVAMATNIRMCEQPDAKGFDDRECITSIEDLDSFIGSRLGDDFLSLPSLFGPAVLEQPSFTVVNKTSIPLDRPYTCHSMSYPYQVLYCYESPRTEFYNVTLALGGDTNDLIHAVTSCHDTTTFKSDHPALKALGINNPGDGQACQILTNAVVFGKGPE